MSERGDRERQDEAEDVGKDGYPVIWHELKHEVREASGHRCVRCGHPYRRGEHGSGEWTPCDLDCCHFGPIRWRVPSTNPDWTVQAADNEPGRMIHAYGDAIKIEARWRILTVHHLDGDKTNLRWWNLVALCQRCHLRVQGTVQMARVYPWPHSEWFKPYVAGYYAWTYLGEELDRQAVEARLDELLALELASSSASPDLCRRLRSGSGSEMRADQSSSSASPARLGAAPSSKAKP